MADHSPTSNTADSKRMTDFEAAGAVVETLKQLPKGRQELVLRWVMESLEIVAYQQPPAPAALPLSTITPVPAPDTSQPGQTMQSVDIASFVQAKAPRSDVQFVTVAAYYYRFVAPAAERKQTINVEVAQDATRLANWDRLINPRSTLNNAKQQGYLNGSGAGEFAVSTVGENLVARTLPGEANQRGSAKSKKALAKKSKKR